MRVVTVPVIPVPNDDVLKELHMAIHHRKVELESDLFVETQPRFQLSLTKNIEALKYVEDHLRRIREDTALTIDIIVPQHEKEK